jgi:hypothetical protein
LTWQTTWNYTGPGCPPCDYEYALSSIVFAMGQFWVQNEIEDYLMTSTDGINWKNGATPTACDYTYSIANAGDRIFEEVSQI